MKRAARLIGLLITTIANAGLAQSRVGSINVGDALINYESTGRGQAIVFIHGWAHDLGAWDDQAAAFSPTHRVIRYDSRGFGRSTGFADITQDPEDLRILLDSLSVRSAYVVGHSRGARVALSFAVAYPDRVSALVLYGAPPPAGYQPMPPGPGVAAMFAMFGEIAHTYGLDSLGKVVAASPLAWFPPNRPDLTPKLQAIWSRYSGRDLLDPHPESGRVLAARMEQLSGLRMPTLVIHGDHEMPLFQLVADTLVRRIPNARRTVIVNGGHIAHWAQPELFDSALSGFFASVHR